MSDSKEIDDILNSIKNKKDDSNIDDNTENTHASQAINFSIDSSLDSYIEIDENYDGDNKMKNKNNKKIIIIVAIVLVIIIAAVIGVFASKSDKEEQITTTQNITQQQTTSTTAAPVNYTNPLTGEKDYNKKAVDKRPVAIVVENAPAARPQWGIDNKTNSPDIIVEGEVEGGVTRMLFMYADYTNIPDKIGPIRSARPPFIRFSQLFDSIFIHWGQSKSKGNYVGANTVFKKENVDHINQMKFSDNVNLFSRDTSRGVSSEHRGIVNGKNVEAAIKQCEFRTSIDNDSFTKLSFNDKSKAVGNPCTSLALKFSSRTNTRSWSYNSEDKCYHTSDFDTDVKRKNLLVLFDNTSYVSKSNYKGSGKTEVYCDYALSGGKGVYASEGSSIEITWSVKNGKLEIMDSNSNIVSLNPGKTWIGYASGNNGGSVN